MMSFAVVVMVVVVGVVMVPVVMVMEVAPNTHGPAPLCARIGSSTAATGAGRTNNTRQDYLSGTLTDRSHRSSVIVVVVGINERTMVVARPKSPQRCLSCSCVFFLVYTWSLWAGLWPYYIQGERGNTFFFYRPLLHTHTCTRKSGQLPRQSCLSEVEYCSARHLFLTHVRHVLTPDTLQRSAARVRSPLLMTRTNDDGQ